MWFDLLVTDADVARTFYAEMFGWQIAPTTERPTTRAGSPTTKTRGPA